MIAEAIAEPIPGCYRIVPKAHQDQRGSFVKTFHSEWYADIGLETAFVEDFYSVSQRCVLRGLHYQAPPKDQIKIVYCVSGVVLDVALDIRPGSPMFRSHLAFELRADAPSLLYLPRGVAHGFFVLSDQAIVAYKTTSVHDPDLDSGIRWDSAGISWPDTPIVSPRDATLPTLEEYCRDPCFPDFR